MSYLETIQYEALNLAEKRAEDLRQSLVEARTPHDFEKATADLQQTIDDLFSAKLAQSGHTIACKAGCHFCCYIKVDALPIEIFLLAEHIRRHFSTEQVSDIRARARTNREKISELSADAQKIAKIPCPLLQNGQCMCYRARPMMCRKYHSHTVAPCEAMYNGSAEKDMRGEVQEITLTLSFVLAKAQDAFKQEGFDSTPYDLSSALDEALANPKCYKRWRQGKTAFSKDLIAKDWMVSKNTAPRSSGD